VADRFWTKVEKGDGPDACWLWTGFAPKYGRIQVDGKSKGAHVVAWELASGDPVPLGMIVCHACDATRCVRNDDSGVHVVNGVEYVRHLFLATNGVNSADMVAKGRQATGERSGSRLHPERLARGDRSGARTHPERLSRGDAHWMRQNPDCMAGDKNPRAVLTWDDVRAIRAAYAEHPYRGFLADMARRYAVSSTQIQYIVRNKSWRE
jgi:hypothetical protein